MPTGGCEPGPHPHDQLMSQAPALLSAPTGALWKQSFLSRAVNVEWFPEAALFVSEMVRNRV